MNDNKEVIQNELVKALIKQVKEFINNPKPISVELKEDELDIFTYFSRDELERVNELTEEQINYVEQLKEKVNLGRVSYDRDTSYLAFNHHVWKELSMKKKVISVLWFKDLLAQEDNKLSANANIGKDFESAFNYNYNQETGEYCFFVDAIKLNEKNIEAPYEVMFNILISNFEDNIILAVNNTKGEDGKLLIKNIDNLVLANSFKNVEVPFKAYNKFMLNEKMSEQEQKDVCLYFNQPKQLEVRKLFNTLDEYMSTGEKCLEVYDSNWHNYKYYLEDRYQEADELYDDLFKVDRKKLYSKYLSKQLENLNKIKSQNCEKEL
jgi:hypothetical protein